MLRQIASKSVQKQQRGNKEGARMENKKINLVPQPHGGAVNRFVKGESGNPKGRPRKYVSTLKNYGYRLIEINDAIQNMISMNIEELKIILQHENSTALEVTIARAIQKSIQKGSLDSLETLLTRVYGKPKETIASTVVTREPLTQEEKEKLDKQLDASV